VIRLIRARFVPPAFRLLTPHHFTSHFDTGCEVMDR
jgi:hypothetical protein